MESQNFANSMVDAGSNESNFLPINKSASGCLINSKFGEGNEAQSRADTGHVMAKFEKIWRTAAVIKTV